MRGRAPGRGPRGGRRRGASSAFAPRRRPRRCRCRRSLRAAAELERLVGIEAALAIVLRLDVADVQKAVAADAEIDERRLNARFEIDDLSFVDVADVVVLAGALDVELFQDAILHDRDPAFFRLRDVDQHFLLHVLAFLVRLPPNRNNVFCRGIGSAADARSKGHPVRPGCAPAIRGIPNPIKPNTARMSRGRAWAACVASSFIRNTPATNRQFLQALPAGRPAPHVPARSTGHAADAIEPLNLPLRLLDTLGRHRQLVPQTLRLGLAAAGRGRLDRQRSSAPAGARAANRSRSSAAPTGTARSTSNTSS